MKRRRTNEASSSTSMIKFLPEPGVGDIATLPAAGSSIETKQVICCNFCGKKFQSPQAMGGHMNSHQIERAEIKEREKKMAFHMAQMEKKAMEDGAKRISILVRKAERKAWDDAANRIAISVERAERKAMEETEKKIPVLKQRAEMKAMEELKATFKQQMMMHSFREHPRIYSPNHPPFSGSGSSSGNTFYIFLESKIGEDYKNEKKSRHEETCIQLDLIGNKSKRSIKECDGFQRRLGYGLDLELNL